MSRRSDISEPMPGQGQKFAWGDLVPGLFVAIPMGLIFVMALWKVSDDRHQAQACAGQSLEHKTWVTGRLRQAGPDFFLQADRWRLLTRGCHGKTRLQCLQNNPGIASLERNLGQSISVQFCEDHAMVYQVGGQRFDVYPQGN